MRVSPIPAIPVFPPKSTKHKYSSMTQDDRLTLFLGQLADSKEPLGLTAGERGFADDCRFAFNLSPKMKKFALKLFDKYGRLIGWKSLEEPPH